MHARTKSRLLLLGRGDFFIYSLRAPSRERNIRRSRRVAELQYSEGGGNTDPVAA
jgi:hypothetical protein